jgi:surface polysaccharide O-acyltransferase-like enzyme
MNAQASPSALNTEQPQKIFYIDNLKVILTVLVVLHHTFITYGAPGSWYYMQKTTQQGALIPMTLFVAVNQSFFMGFFFFLSAYFIRPSYQKKGASRFVKDRLLRLGIPLLFYTFILGPFMNYLVYYFGKGHHITFIQFLSGYDDWIDFGVLWFVAALLLFTLIYVAWCQVAKSRDVQIKHSLSVNKVLLIATRLGVISFLVRLVFPVGWVLNPPGFQLGHFTQYVALFIGGILAYRYNLLESITYKQGKRAAWIAVLLVIIIFPLFYVLLTTLKFPSSWFSGGFHGPALMYAMWEQLTGLCIIMALLGIGKEKLNRNSALRSKLSRSAFAVYIFHPLVVISITLLLSNWAVDPAVKLLIAAPLVVIGSFLLASLVLLIPGVKRII